MALAPAVWDVAARAWLSILVFCRQQHCFRGKRGTAKLVAQLCRVGTDAMQSGHQDQALQSGIGIDHG